jgi:hypothetical protein
MQIRSLNHIVSFLVTLLPLAAAVPARGADPAEGVAFFEQKVRPLLVERCYECHAVTAKNVKGELLLDSRAGWSKGGDRGQVIVPGEPGASLLIKAVRYEHADLQMPPKGKLPQADIETLVQWVKLGAPDPREAPAIAVPVAAAKKGIDLEEGRKLWSLQPLKVAPPPKVKDEAWPKTAADRFVLAKLEEKGLSPNPAVDRRKLIRRASFGLTGLPPTPQQVDAFVNDPAPDAYEKLIDRLLASPAYGERWASHWLDVVRFGESDGFEHDYDRPHAYHFRDFVIRALNDDLPYDTFVKWQLAGDEYAPDNPLALMATGFLTAGVFPTQITEKEFESTRYNQLDDMAATTGVAFLGLTVGCARCHDHKFDPIPMADYYRFTATFTRAVRSDIDVDLSTPEEREAALASFNAKRAELLANVTAFERDALPARFNQYVSTLKGSRGAAAASWSVLHVDDVKTSGTKLTKLPDGSLLRVGGETPAKDEYIFTARTDATGITGIRLEALTHESFPKKGPGLAPNGNFVLGALDITAAPADGSSAAVELAVARSRATHQQNTDSLSVAATFDEDPKTGWAVDNGGIGKDQAAVFELDQPPAGFPGGTVLTFRLRFEHPNKQHLIGRPRLSLATAPPPLDPRAPEGPPANVARTLAALAQGKGAEPVALEQASAWFATTLAEYQQLKAALAAHDAAGPARRVVKVQVTSEGLPPVKNHADERGYPHSYAQTHVLRRGDPNQKLEVATQSFLQVLMRGGKRATDWQSPPPSGWRTSYRRRALAEWMTDTKNGAGELAARVIVNRLWQHHVGRGIVATPSDYGNRGAPPTHPELLDYLASELIRNGWRLKPIHKLIMTSSVYATSGDFDAAKAQADPDNGLLWRRPLRRLESEAIRDAMLSISGMLDGTMYGPGTLDSASRRRSVYFTVKRSQLIPMMLVFDAPEPLSPMADRPTTTIAPQALLLMNNPQVRRCAEALAKRCAPDGATPAESAVRSAYRLALAREATAGEAAESVAFVEEQAKSHAAASRPDARAAALADFCQGLMCLNEFVYVD